MRTRRQWLAAAVAAGVCGASGCQTWVGGLTLPSPRYLQHYPQYFPPDPAFPLPRELATQTDPDGILRPDGAGGAGGGAPGAGPTAPGQPVPGTVGNQPSAPGGGPGLNNAR